MPNSNHVFNYQRADDFPEPKERPLISIFEGYGQLKDVTKSPAWQKHRLYQVYDKAAAILSDLQERANTVQKLELGDYTDEAKTRRRRDHLRKPYIDLLELIQEERRSSKQSIENLRSHALRMSEPVPPKDIADRISHDSKMTEIRSLLRQKDTQGRLEMINKTLSVNDSSFLWATIGSPDELIPPDRLNEIRMSYAYQQTPTLENALDDVQELATVIEAKTGQIGGTATAILQSKKLEIPVSTVEYFQFFPPRNDREEFQQNRFIETENHVIRQRETLDQSQQHGVSL